MLALMILLGVAFSVYMQTERVASGNYKNDVKARHLLDAGLALALEDLRGRHGAVASGTMPATWSLLQSTNAGGTAVDANLVQSMLPSLPRSVWSGKDISPMWMDRKVGGTAYVGRVAYVVLNASGLLDANTVGSVSNGLLVVRSAAGGGREIQLSALPEVRSPWTFVNARDTAPGYLRFESVSELSDLAKRAGAFSMPSENFATYSAFPLSGYPGGTNTPVVDLSGDEDDLKSRRTAIEAAIQSAAGLDAARASFVFDNLLDYVDADSEPQDLGSACTELVPMFNEVYLRNRIDFDAAGTLTWRASFTVEWIFPFVRPSTNRYVVVYELSFTNSVAGFPAPAKAVNTVDANYAGDFANPSAVHKQMTSWSLTLNGADYSAFLGMTNKVTAEVRLQMREVGSVIGKVVDEVPYPGTVTPVRLEFAFEVPKVATNLVSTAFVDSECYDPRFNWDPSAGGRQWRISTNPSLGYINHATTNYFATRVSDGYPELFVADRPLVSIGELSYLLRGGRRRATDGDMWNSLRICDEGPLKKMDLLLDYFVLGTSAVARGLLNPNTSNTAALTAAILDMPVERYPNDPNARRVTADVARQLAEAWQDPSFNPVFGFVRRPSDIGIATNMLGELAFLAQSTGMFLQPLDPMQRESFFRNVTGVFHPRQGYYYVLVLAQVTKEVRLPSGVLWTSILAGQRGLAEVWMDPLANDEGAFPTLVRSFHIVTD
jgi:hypothetical protein